jgi:hypothetical protein
MQILKIALLTILVLMSLVAGFAKIVQMPQELEFLAHLGLGATAVSVVGLVQTAGGMLLLLPKTRLIGAIAAIATLIISSLALFTAGNAAIGLITLFPIAIGVSIILDNSGRNA